MERLDLTWVMFVTGLVRMRSGYQNLTEEETAQQTEEDGSIQEDEENEKKEEI
jgi:hypothetical protein